ncbi:MAG: DUF2309 domain-containing protein [Bacteroidia bacterium]|nr:DUF2309 domain-containing protein [Bacteroidia bacterium]
MKEAESGKKSVYTGPDTADESLAGKTGSDSATAHFDLKELLHAIRYYLPAQSALKDFIHHNSLHAFQHMPFYQAIFKAAGVFGYRVTLQLREYRSLFANGRIREDILDRILNDRKGEAGVQRWKHYLLAKPYESYAPPLIGRLRAHWKDEFHIDLDALVHPLLFRLLSAYLDQGISSWKFPHAEGGFLASLYQLERSGPVSLFKTARVRKLFLSEAVEPERLLQEIVGDERYFSQYLYDQQFSHQGWSGFVASVEEKPEALLDRRKITLGELIVFELYLELDALEFTFGKNRLPLCARVGENPLPLFADHPLTELNEVLSMWQDAFEWSYYDEVLAGIRGGAGQQRNTVERKIFQAVFCIDERECSLRRHLEQVAPACETLGAPGFFGVEFYFQPLNGKFYEKLCPAPVTPKYLIKEYGAAAPRKHELLYADHTHRLWTGWLSSLTLGFFAGIKSFQQLFAPKMSPAISNAYAHMNGTASLSIENTDPEHRENGLQIGFTVEEMSQRVEAQLRGMGLIRDFAPIVYIIAHGSSSANNPHHGAHDCGACSGRPGSVNARVFAFMANHAGVRAILKGKGLHIPEETQFVGGLHDTAADELAFFDEDLLSISNRDLHAGAIKDFEKALDLNARERSRRFASVNTRAGIKKVRRAIRERSVSLFEPRPELGHGTNTLCIVGRRELSKHVFLDRRAFLNSYDYRTDPEGRLLPNIMRPLGPVCGGINLEYYFSRVDNYKIGAGTKLPHNVVGLFAVANSSDGDLRPGLPLQMIEVHDPMRLLIIVEHDPEVVLKTIQSSPEMYEWYINEWVHLVAVHPETRQFFRFSRGHFRSYEPLCAEVPAVRDVQAMLESAREMKTNRIEDATKENLPVMILNG